MFICYFKLFAILIGCTLFFNVRSSKMNGTDSAIFQSAMNKIKSGSFMRIDNGKDALEGQFPFIVALTIAEMFCCACSIITVNYILTAAHCVKTYNVALMKARVGSIYWSSGGLLLDIIDKKVHSGFKMIGHRTLYDIALLKLNQSLVFNPIIQPISLASYNPAVGELVTIVGWGPKCRFCDASDILQFDYGTPKYPCNHDSELCIASPVGHGVCNGDSGGPAIHENTLVGITSYGDDENETCATEKPDVFVSVPHLKTWIVQNSDLKF